MKRYLLVVLAAAMGILPLSKSISAEQTKQDAVNASGTTWSGTDIWGEPISLYFAPNGHLVYKTKTGIHKTGTWQQNSDNIFYEMNNKFVEHDGKIQGNEMKGEGVAGKGKMKKGRWSLKKAPVNEEALVVASSTAILQSQSFVLPLLKNELLGTYEFTLSDGRGSLTTRRLVCEDAGCRHETTTMSENKEPAHTVGRTFPLKMFSNMPQLYRSINYSRTNRANKPIGDSFLTELQTKLMPYLESDGSVDRCVGLPEMSALCRPANNPWSEPVLLLFEPTFPPICKNGFCGYLIYPLFKVVK